MNSNNRGGLGCALVVMVAIVAAIIFILSQAPWLLIAGPALFILGIIAIIVLADVTSDDVLVTSDEAGGFTARRLVLINRLRTILHKPPVWQVPKIGVTFEERKLVKQASQLTVELTHTLQNSPVPTSTRLLIQEQASDVPANLVRALWRLERLRHIERSLDVRTDEGKQRKEQIAAMEHQVVTDMQRAFDRLSSTPVNLMQIELAQAEQRAQRLVADLNEANQQLRDVSSVFDELHTQHNG